MRIYVIRHGETDANVSGVFQGRFEGQLTEAGIELAQLTGRALTDVRFDAAFTSPLVRAFGTAREVLKESGNTCPLTTDERLLEVHMGDYEGRRFRPGESQIDDEFCHTFFTDPFSLGSFPNGEDVYDVCARTQDFLTELATRDYETVLVSTHGFALRAMLNKLYDDPSDFWQGHVPYNCSVSIVDANAGECRLVASDAIYYDKNLCIDRYANC